MISCTYKNKVNLAYLQDKMFNLLYYLYKIHIVDGIFANSDFNLFDSSFQKNIPIFMPFLITKDLSDYGTNRIVVSVTKWY